MSDPRRLEVAEQLICSRQNVSPKRLVEPGPTPEQLGRIFAAAAAAPDHGRLLPWRFVVISKERRDALAEVFARALIDRDASASAAQIGEAREKAYRGAVLVLCVVDLGPREPNTPHRERLISLGCALQNMMLTALAMGFGSGLTSGQSLGSPALHDGFGLADAEEPVCFLSLGAIASTKPRRARPDASRFVSVL